MLGSLGSVVLVVGIGGRDGSGRGYLAAGLFLLSTVGFIVVQIDRQRAQRVRALTQSRRHYLRHLRGVRAQARAAADAQRRASHTRHPPVGALPALAEEGTRVWERAPTDLDFLHVRCGTSAQPLAVRLVAPDPEALDQGDTVATSAARRLLAVQRAVSDVPATLDLRGLGCVEICGPEAEARSAARAMLCSAAALHPPAHLTVAVLADDRRLVHWDWLKWLPHAQSPELHDAAGPARLVATSRARLEALLSVADSERSGPGHVLLVLDDEGPPDDRSPVLEARHARTGTSYGVTLVRISPAPTGLRLVVGPDSSAEVTGVTVDQCDLTMAEALARRLTAHRPAASGTTTVSGDTGVGELFGLADPAAFDPHLAWRPRPPSDRLRVPIGHDDGGEPVTLDLKESAQGGMGPHGLVIGATGSGKSELLRSLVLGLALTHAPDDLSMVLVDFKGGATFAGLAGLPQVSAVITNLAQELTLVDRMEDALSGELLRRQQVLREAGNLASVEEYARARSTGSALEPLPSLLVVVDEFSELLAAKPEFIDLFVAIGRLGRSLGLHLLLASQRLEEGRLRGLESHLSYRIGLRTFSAGESRGVLGVPDAYELPSVPGLGFLRADQSSLVRFQATYVSGAAVAPRDEPSRSLGVGDILPFTVAEVRAHAPSDGVPSPTGSPAGPSYLDAAVTRLAGQRPRAHRIWLPPLDVPDTLADLMPDLRADPELGLVSPRWRSCEGRVLPLGSVDRPREQRRETLTVDLSGAAGHLAVVGGPRSGKSTVLRTLVAGLALTTTPQESQLYVLDFGGGAFASMRELPHVAGLGARAEPDVVRRIVAELGAVVDRREAGGGLDDGYGDLFLIVDGWSTLRSDFDDLELELQLLAGRGLAFGLHLVAAGTRWADFRASTRDLFGTRLELRLGDPLDSEVDRRQAGLVPSGRPGRGLTPDALHFLAAVPRLDGGAEPANLDRSVSDLVAEVAGAWSGPPGPKLRLLPEEVGLECIVDRITPGERRLVLGLGETDLGPAGVDPRNQPHLLIYGDAGSGKTATLRAYLRELVRTRTPEDAQVVAVDYRRTLLDELPEEYRLGYLTSAAEATPTIKDLAAFLMGRVPGSEVTAQQLRDRSWWRGADVYVVVDDYDLVAIQQSSPLAPLEPLLAQARDVGLHLVVARRSGGAARAGFEPVLQSMRELAMPCLLLSGSPDEGVLVGSLRPQRQPPGRGRLWTREQGVQVLQVGWTEPTPG